MNEGEASWYFAYGSNLDPRTFLGRRRMRPLDTTVAKLRDWALCFDLAVGKSDRGVANLYPSSGGHVWGVAYLITAQQFAWLDRTEGVHWGAYRRLPIEMLRNDAHPDGEKLAGFTYVSERRRTGRRPSQRYMGLLLHGARHHGLPAEYLRFLHGFQLARDERTITQLRIFPP